MGIARSPISANLPPPHYVERALEFLRQFGPAADVNDMGNFMAAAKPQPEAYKPQPKAYKEGIQLVHSGRHVVSRKGLGLDPPNYSKNSHLPLR